MLHKLYLSAHQLQKPVSYFSSIIFSSKKPPRTGRFSPCLLTFASDAAEVQEALRLLDELGEIEMKPRERYDYDTYREQARPQLLEGIEKQEKRAAERARNKNLK